MKPSGKPYVADATKFSAGTFLYEIRNGEEVTPGQFLITKKKRNSIESSGSN